MNYWIIALPREAMVHCIKIGVFGRSQKAGVCNVREGDKVACYVTKESKLVAFGKATSDYYMDDSPVFLSGGVFPDRFRFTAKCLSKNEEIDFKSLINDLEFITNKFYWSAFFKQGIKRISENDWSLIWERRSQISER